MKLGFDPSPGRSANNVAAPDGPAYFTSRGSLMGQVAPHVVAAAFGVFKPEIVARERAVRLDAHRRADDLRGAPRRRGRAARARAAASPNAGVTRAAELLERAADAQAEPGRPLFAGLRSQWDDPHDPWTRLFHLGDMLRECRGDAHVAAWTAAGLDAVEIGLLTEAYIGSAAAHVHPHARLERRGARRRGRASRSARLARRRRAHRRPGSAAARRSSRRPTSRCGPASHAVGDDIDELCELLEPWGAAMRDAGGYVGGRGRSLAEPRVTDPLDIRIEDVPERQRYELTVDGRARRPRHVPARAAASITFVHTEIDDAYEGHGLGGRLAAGGARRRPRPRPHRASAVPVHRGVHRATTPSTPTSSPPEAVAVANSATWSRVCVVRVRLR